MYSCTVQKLLGSNSEGMDVEDPQIVVELLWECANEMNARGITDPSAFLALVAPHSQQASSAAAPQPSGPDAAHVSTPGPRSRSSSPCRPRLPRAQHRLPPLPLHASQTLPTHRRHRLVLLSPLYRARSIQLLLLFIRNCIRIPEHIQLTLALRTLEVTYRAHFQRTNRLRLLAPVHLLQVAWTLIPRSPPLLLSDQQISLVQFVQPLQTLSLQQLLILCSPSVSRTSPRGICRERMRVVPVWPLGPLLLLCSAALCPVCKAPVRSVVRMFLAWKSHSGPRINSIAFSTRMI